MKILGISHGKVRFNDLPEATNHLSRRHPRENSIRASPAGRPRTLFGRKHDHPQPLYVRPGRLGIIEELGPAAYHKGLSEGDRVVWFYRANCGMCYQCSTGRPLYCPNMTYCTTSFAEIHDLEGGPISTKFRILCRWNRASFSRTSWIACAYSMKRRSTPIPRSQSSASITRAF